MIGGSLAGALRRLDDPPRVIGVEPDAASRGHALRERLVDEAIEPIDAEIAFSRSDLVLIATPATSAGEWLGRIGAMESFSGLVTDVASTKSGVYLAARTFLGDRAVFIGGHPMAGSERSGVEAANPELLKGAYYVLTPADDTPPDAYQRLHALITSLGARVIAIQPDSHDEAVAAISHVPHVAASALINLASERAGSGQEVLRLASGGFKDMTRIAAGSPDLWTGICLDNRDAIIRGIDEYQEQLSEFRERLRGGDALRIGEWLAGAAALRRALPAQWVPASERLAVLSVPLQDRPGMVSAVTQAAARAGCNIEDIEIDHTSEDTAVLQLVLTDEGDHQGLVADLAANGFEPILRPLSDET